MNRITSFPCTLVALSAAAVLALSGCGTTIGPKVVGKSFGDYNRAVSDVLREELLLNIVRRRYYESPQFTAFSGISTSRSISGDLSVNAGRAPFFRVVGAGANVSQSDFPTYSILPQQGPEISSKLHEQIPLDAFSQMAGAGYPLDLVFVMLAQDVAGIRGVDVGTGAEFKGGSRQYVQMLANIRQLEASNKLVLTDVVWEEPYFAHPFSPETFTPSEVLSGATEGNSYASLDGGESFYVTNRTFLPAIWIDPAHRTSGTGRDLINLLQLDPDPLKRVWRLENIKVLSGPDLKGEAQSADRLPVRTRSYYGVLNLLSHGVEVPDDDENMAAFETTKYDEAVEAGTAPDITGYFQIYFSKTKPAQSSVAVKYRDGWFYIDDRDRGSKRVFNALYDLYNLQVAPSSQGGGGAPVLTLPAR